LSNQMGVVRVHGGGRAQPQQLAPAATASDRASVPQQASSACASTVVPQHGPAAAAGSGRSRVARDGLAQQPPVPGTVGAAAGSPAKTPGTCSLMMISCLDNR
jgi:hypothetical protein